jgi:hypothetical protein
MARGSTPVPVPVRAAVLLMRLAALGHVVLAVMLIASAETYLERMLAELRAFDMEPGQFVASEPWMLVAPVYGIAMLFGAFALFLLAVAHSVSAGHQAARIVAWVGMGMGLIWYAPALPIAVVLGALLVVMPRNEGPELDLALLDIYPPAMLYGGPVLGILSMIAFTLAIVLLARRSVGWYFRGRLRRADVWPHRIGEGAAHGLRPAPGSTSHSGAAPGLGLAARSGRAEVGGPVSGESNQVTEALRKRELALLVRRHQRGELTDEEFETARRLLLDQP